MTATLMINAKCSMTLWNDEKTWEAPYDFASINDALSYAEEQIDVTQQALGATIYETDTGIVLAHCAWDDGSTPEDLGYMDEPDLDWGYNEDEGFDPYLGEYTWDC